MTQEDKYVNYFYEKYEGRVALGVGYDQNLSEIYPFVYEDIAGNSIGIAALCVYNQKNTKHVQIYHVGSFKNNRGNGSQILQALCFQADKYQIILSLSPISMPSGIDAPMSDERLREWYGNFGFKGSSHFRREPSIIKNY